MKTKKNQKTKEKLLLAQTIWNLFFVSARSKKNGWNATKFLGSVIVGTKAHPRRDPKCISFTTTEPKVVSKSE